MLRRMREVSGILIATLFVLLCVSTIKSTELDHRYNDNDWVPFYANKIAPRNSPSETYAYYDLPFCFPDDTIEKKSSLVEKFGGDRLVPAPYQLEFRVNKDSQVACTKNLTREEVSQFQVAIAQAYEFQMYYDDLPIQSFIGKLDYADKNKSYTYHLYTHIDFEIFYNHDRVITISPYMNPLTTVELIENKEIEVKFSYSALWMETDDSFEKRMDKYYSSSIEPYWFFISCLTVPILIGLMAIFYDRVLKNSFIKQTNYEEFAENQGETLWKNIHLKRKAFFAAVVGLGTQMIILVFLIIMLGLFGVFHQYSRGALLIGLMVVYSITSCIAGFVAVSLYTHLEGTNWVLSLVLTGSFFSMPVFNTFQFLNYEANAYGLLSALPVGAISVLLCIWCFGALPLLVIGGIVGKNKVPELMATCNTALCHKDVPRQLCYKGLFPQMVLAGIFPFSIIYNELYYLFAGIWGPETFTEYPSLLIVAIILVFVTAFVTVAMTYSHLAAGNQDWWWRSYLYGGSTGLYVYVYCLYYYHQRSDMWGFLQTSFFLGYMACVSYGLFLMLGSVGFNASLLFVRHIYGSIKRE